MAVGEHRSFSGAARALHTVQSNISSHISKLENELGTPLIDRATNELTYEGHLVAARAQRVERELDGIVSDIASVSETVSGSVHLGVVGTIARWFVPLLLDRIAVVHPAVTMVIVDGTSSLLVPQLANAGLDLAMVNLPQSDRSIRLSPLFSEDRVLIVPNAHPLAHAESVSLSDLAEFPLLLEPRGSFFRAQMDSYAEAHNFAFQPKAEIDGVRLLASMAFAGHGLAILPATAAPTWLEGDWKRVRLNDAPRRSIGLARRKTGLLGPAAEAVDALVRTLVEENIPAYHGLHSMDGNAT